ncbi:hypothetical protein CERSUDRAFT_89816 [Gelatoporia subvermispora B]|uniref:Uncharacterized protein n=1 Tax=Ceriporiopsis subvermispora (strain B) TaxID=914234 RepID=M2R9Z1_CERS8|nr:hypothetical protein CERSUDRAFT_89816 [Gelatoporia subvermispora B]
MLATANPAERDDTGAERRSTIKIADSDAIAKPLGALGAVISDANVVVSTGYLPVTFEPPETLCGTWYWPSCLEQDH